MRAEVANELGRPQPAWGMQMPSRPLMGLNILVIEDSRYASEALRLLAVKSGARIRRANSLASAYRHLRGYRPEVAIVDLGLPDGSGAELIASLHNSDIRVPAILGISGDSDMRDCAIAAGADGFLCKPVESLALFQQTILQALPTGMRVYGLLVVPDTMIKPDETALRDDLLQVFETLCRSEKPDELIYIARFLAGVARSANDAPLEAAANDLVSCGGRGQTRGDIARINDMLGDRLENFIRI